MTVTATAKRRRKQAKLRKGRKVKRLDLRLLNAKTKRR